jgi:hypothetical protein
MFVIRHFSLHKMTNNFRKYTAFFQSGLLHVINKEENEWNHS